MAIQPSGEEVQLAEVVTAPPATAEPAAMTADREMPATASPLPLLALLGLTTLGVAFRLRGFAKRIPVEGDRPIGAANVREQAAP